MKKMILIISLLALAACSSKSKDETVEPAEPSVTDATPTTTDTAGTPMTTTVTEPTTTAATPAPIEMPSSGNFPPIEGTERSSASCNMNSDSRVIAVIDRNGGGCGVVYTKFGNKETIAMANSDMGYCDRVQGNVKGNLEGAGFTCGGGAATTTTAPAPTPTETTTETPAETKTETN